MLGIQEAIEQVLTYVKGVWIKKRYIIVSTWLICPAGWLYVGSMPDVYSSSARIFVDTNSLLRPLMRGLAIFNNPAEDVNLVARTLLVKPTLEKIAREADLDLSVTTQDEMDALTDRLKSKINLQATRSQNNYVISYSDSDPVLAQKIVQITMDEFFETSLGSNRRASDTAEEFITQQIEEYEQRLEEAEQRLADFKRSRMDRAPGSSSGYYQQLQSNVSQLQQTELKILEIESELEASKAKLAGEAPIFGLVNPGASDGSQGNSSIRTRYDTRIANLEGKLDELLVRYTENHPDVVKTQSLLDGIIEKRDELVKGMSDIAQETGSYSQFGNVNQNPVYQEIKLDLARYESQLASLKVRAEDFRGKIVKLEEMVDLVPQIEAESQALNRDYEITRSKYLELVGRKEQAELSRKAEATTDDVQFRILDQPKVPKKPSGPKRGILYTLILFVGFGSGLAIAFLVSQLKPIVISAGQLSSTFGIPVLGNVSHTEAAAMAKTDRKRMIIFSISSSFIIGIFAILLWAESRYGRLPVELLGGLI